MLDDLSNLEVWEEVDEFDSEAETEECDYDTDEQDQEGCAA